MNSNTDQFLETKHWAIAGISRSKSKFGNTLFKTLAKRGRKLMPVHPEITEFEGVKCFKSLQELPSEVDALLINTSPEHSVKLIREATDRGISQIWLQQGAESPEIIKEFENSSINLVHGKCILMYAKPVTSFHAIHRGIARLFGKV